jgi:hypothetical protein
LTIQDQIAQAQALIANGKRIEELAAKRQKLAEELAVVDVELGDLLGGATTTPSRTKQKCSVCGKEGHSKRTCPEKT